MIKIRSNASRFKYLAVLLVYFVLSATGAQAQNRTIRGTVKNEGGQPVIGATVVVTGTTTGTTTSVNGDFTLNLSSDSGTLTVSYLGFEDQEVAIGSATTYNIVLREASMAMDEVVVIGYGTINKSHLTGSVAKVNTEGLTDLPYSRVDQALQGKVAGLEIRNITSEVGESPQIRVRGMGSISANDTPYVIVDGFPVEDGLGSINMNDVESIEVLKDAASAAIYGSRAANGVIIVTTKSGSEGKAQYNLKLSSGIKNTLRLHPLMSAGEYVAFRVHELKQIGADKMPDEEFAYMVMNDLTGYTDWQKMPLRTAHINDVSLSVRGGGKNVRYMISGGYTNDQGIMVHNDLTKLNIRAKIDATLSKRVKVGINIAPTYTDRTMPGTNFQDYYKTPSWMPARHNEITSALTGVAEGTFTTGEDFNYKDYTGVDLISGETRTVNTRPYGSANPNPASRMANISRDRQDYRLQTSAYLDIELILGLNFRTSNNINFNYMEQNQYNNMGATKKGETNRGDYQTRMGTVLTSENYFTFTKDIGKHNINAVAGFSVEKSKRNTSRIVGQDFPTDYIHTLNGASTILLANDNGARITGTWRSEASYASFFGRVNYAYDDKYLFSASMRGDGSSKFGANNRWGYFPSVSVGWRISEEKFIKDNASWLNQLKFRVSYGVTGTDNIDDYVNTNTVDVLYYTLGAGNGNVVSGIGSASTVMGNENLKWEQTNEFNSGFDLMILKNRIGISFDYYYSTTKSLLFKRDINSISGYDQAWTNLGKIRNKGVEIELTTRNVQKGKFSWTSGINYSMNRNKLIDLGGPSELITNLDSRMYIARVGDPAIQFYGLKTIGVWETMEDIKNNPSHISDTRAGGLRTWNANGDDVINDEDYVPLGNPFADFTWGFTNTFRYGSFDLSILFQGSVGGKIWNHDDQQNEIRKWNKKYVKGRWLSEEHPGDGKTPFYGYGIDHRMTDYAIQDATYISLRDITLGYTLPERFTKGWIGGLRVYISAQNLGYWWPKAYRGINPEALYTSGGYSSPLVSGYQQGAFPVQRIINFGLDINF